MLIQNGNEIRNYGYEHWTGEPTTPDCHEVRYIPQSVADGWDAFCSCGQWRAFASFEEFQIREALFTALLTAWQKHRDAAMAEAQPG